MAHTLKQVDFDSLPACKKRAIEKLEKEEEQEIRLAKEEKHQLQLSWLEYTQKNKTLIAQHKSAKDLYQNPTGVKPTISENQSYQLVEEQIKKLEDSVRAVDENCAKVLRDINERRDKLVEEIRKTQVKESETISSEEEEGIQEETTPDTPRSPITPREPDFQLSPDRELGKERKASLSREIHRLDNQVGVLLLKLKNYQQQLKGKHLSAYDIAVLEREFSKTQIELDITKRRLQTRHQIKGGARLDFDQQSESELSDGGYSGVESDTEYSHQFVIRDKKVRKRRRRIPKVKKEDYIKMNDMKWSMKDIPKFHGDRRQGETPSAHLMEFTDFIRNIGLEARDGDIEKVIGYFMQSLKHRARQWFDLTMGSTPQNTVVHWNKIKDEFLKEYNPVGSTREQQIKAWKEMKWDPSTESLTDFVYRYKELGKYLGYPDEQLLQSFLCCIPCSMYVYVMNATTLADAIVSLKKGMALASIVTPEEKKDKSPVVPFMIAAEKNVSFSSDTLMADKIKDNVEKVVEERVSSLTQTMEGKIESLTAALDRFQSDQRGRSQSRDSTEGRDGQSRSPYRKNEQWNRSRSPSGNRGGRGGGSRPFCNYCKKDGHVVSTCWTLEAKNNGRPSRGNGNRGGRGGFNNRPQGGNRFNSNRGNFRQERQFNRPQGSQKREVANVVKGVMKALKKNGVEMKSTN